MTDMRKTIIFATLAVLACQTFTGCGSKESIKARIENEATLLRRPREETPVPVKVCVVRRENVLSSTSYVGRIEPSKSALVLNQYPGTLEEFNTARGRSVRKGEVLAKVHSEAIQSAYDIAAASLAQAQDGYDRTQKIYKSGGVTELKMVEIRTKLSQAKAAEASAKKALDECTIRAPFSGVIGETFCHCGEHIGVAAPIVQLLDIGEIEIHFNVPESEYGSIATGSEAEVEIPAAGKTVQAFVAVKGISASALSHTYDFTLKSISDSRNLMPGMTCKVRLRSSDEGLIVIPATAVMTDMQGRYIWGVTPDDTVCKTYITVAGYADKGIIISEGLSEGERVIVEGSRKVSTGMKVKTEER